MNGLRAWAFVARSIPWRVLRLLAMGAFIALGGRS